MPPTTAMRYIIRLLCTSQHFTVVVGWENLLAWEGCTRVAPMIISLFGLMS